MIYPIEMIRAMILSIVLSSTPTNDAVASQYANGVMDTVIRNRQEQRAHPGLPADLSVFETFIASYDCNDIGRIVAIRANGSDWRLGLVTDCANPVDGGTDFLWKLSPYGVHPTVGAVEVDYGTASDWNTLGRAIDVEIAWSEFIW